MLSLEKIRTDNRRSLATFDCKSRTSLSLEKSRDSLGAVRVAATTPETRAILVHSDSNCAANEDARLNWIWERPRPSMTGKEPKTGCII